jgi:hypothetical protein
MTITLEGKGTKASESLWLARRKQKTCFFIGQQNTQKNMFYGGSRQCR